MLGEDHGGFEYKVFHSRSGMRALPNEELGAEGNHAVPVFKFAWQGLEAKASWISVASSITTLVPHGKDVQVQCFDTRKNMLQWIPMKASQMKREVVDSLDEVMDITRGVGGGRSCV